MHPRALAASLVALSLLGCGDPEPPPTEDAAVAMDAGFDGGTDAGPPPAPSADYLEPGPFAVGNQRLSLTDAARARTLPVEVWYPADESARAAAEMGQALAAFEEGERRAALEALIADAPASCLRLTTGSAPAPDLAPGAEPWPLVVFSHCHSCTRFDMAEVAERLASFGVVVAAPDHEGNTLWDDLEMMSAPVGGEFLEVRVADVRFVLDALLDDSNAEVPEVLRGRLDPARVGVMGHSFGAATTGVVAGRDDRVIAAMAVAAPISALGGGIRAPSIDVPFVFVVAQEDNSIGEAGNDLIRREHARLGAPSLLVEVQDAGHWGFSDHAGLDDSFAAGCGSGTRQTGGGEAFDYLDPVIARDIAADVAAGFFARHLLGDEGGLTPLLEPHPSGMTTATYREP